MVITLDKRKRPLGHCTEKRARKLLEARRAVVYRYYPFTIIIKDIDVRKLDTAHDYRVGIDPGSKTTGIAVTDDDKVILFTQIEHRGEQVVGNLKTRQFIRRNRRSRETWYRRCKFKDVGKYETPRPEGWLPPSQRSIEGNVVTWVNKLIKLLGPCSVSLEGVKFDPQLMENPDISGKEYQQGTLYGYKMKAYLTEKYQHTCQYCGGESSDHRLEWEHMVPKSRGGSDTVKNATLACHECNQAKGDLAPEEWLASLKGKKKFSKLDSVRVACLEKVIAGKKVGSNYRYAAWANAQRWQLWEDLKNLSGVTELEWSTGGRTAYNRTRLGIPKDHHLDALCVGKHVPTGGFKGLNQKILHVKATGRGTRFIGQCNKCGVITVKYDRTKRHKRVNGLQTGDIVRAEIPNGKYAGTHIGRIMIRASGSHDIRKADGTLVTGTKKSSYSILQHMDGYAYKYA